jgi:hypothetical protein
MGAILSFGAKPEVSDQPVEDITFEYFGENVRLSYDFGETVFVDWVEQWKDVDENEARTFTAVKDLMREVVHPDDFDTFWKLVRANKQGMVKLMELVAALVEATTERPTSQPADSVSGQPTTPPLSGDDSFSRVIKNERPDRQVLAFDIYKQRQAREARELASEVSG